MEHWDRILREALQFARTCRGVPFFRGQADESWVLSPKLSRENVEWDSEARMFLSFSNLGAHLFPSGVERSWDQLALMQHHGLPTRLLDWSETFAVALHFAIRESRSSDAAVWILNPFTLNELAFGKETIMYLSSTSLKVDYADCFLDNTEDSFGKVPGSIAAVFAKRYSTRMRSQRGAFTVHFDFGKPIEELFPAAVKKFVIPNALFSDARSFLQLSGINEFTLFQDFDALCRYIIEEERPTRGFKRTPDVAA